MTVQLAVPLASIDPTDWLVYADYAEEFSGKICFDTARRIAFVLEHWDSAQLAQKNCISGSYLRLSAETLGAQPWLFLYLYRKPYCRRNQIRQDMAELHWTANNEYLLGNISRSWPPNSRIILANPTIVAATFRGNHWLMLKFFKTALHPPSLKRVLPPEAYREYQRRFNHVNRTGSLLEMMHHRYPVVRRVCWKHGERLLLDEPAVQDGGHYQTMATLKQPGRQTRKFWITFDRIQHYRLYGVDWMTLPPDQLPRKFRLRARDWIPA